MKNNLLKLLLAGMSLFIIQSTYAQNELSKSKNASPIMEFLSKNKAKYDLSEQDLQDIKLNKEVVSDAYKVSHNYLNQTHKGIKIFNAISVAGIKNNKVFHFSNKFKSKVGERINTEVPKVTMLQAIQSAASHFNLEGASSLSLKGVSNGKSVFTKGNLSQEDIPVELVYFETPDGDFKLSWDLSIYTLDSNHWWSVRVDATTGEILNVTDWVIKCSFGGDHTKHGVEHVTPNYMGKASFSLFKTSASMVADGSQYNVYPMPIESPNHGNRSIVSEPADAVASPYGWHDTDGVVGAEYTITRGNNVLAQDDTNGDNGDGVSPDGSASLDFDFPIDLSQQPVNYLDASTTNLFYWSNIMHDILYTHGFDEASGNFQENNYGRGGTEGDYLLADAQDGGGLNNANMATPSDGNNPRMQMFLWSGPAITTPILSINGGSLAGGYTVALPSTGDGADGTGNITRPNEVPVTADIVIVDDGTATGEEGCNALTNGSEVNGKIAFIRRGSCNFTTKIQNAQDAGAVAVIVGNHNNPTNDPDYAEYVGMYGVTDPPFTIPSIFINFTDGQSIVDAIGNGETLNATIVYEQPVNVDGSLDNGIIAHEYAHGISTRLTGGPDTSNCLTNNFQQGEGWSDWFGLMTTIKATDVGSTPRGIATFSVNQPTTGLGIRLRHYTTDMSVNEFTFESTNDNTVEGTDGDGNPIIRNQRVHYIGSLWGTMLWDLTWAYIDKYGFDSDLINGNGGNNRVMRVVIEGMKLQGCNPDFTDARDGILAADTAITGGQDQCLIWEVFARRGLGVNASEGVPFILEDQVNSFDVPDSSDPTLANCTTLSASSFTQSDYTIYPNPVNDLLNIGVNKNLGYATISLLDINGREVLKIENTELLNTISLDVNGMKSGMYILSIKGDYINTNEKVIIE